MKRIGRRLTAALLWGGLLLTAGGCQEGLGTSYETVSPQVGEIVNLVEDTGSVTYRDPASLIPVVSGKIVSCLVEEGDIETVFRHPRHPYTQRLIAAIPTRHRKEETP